MAVLDMLPRPESIWNAEGQAIDATIAAYVDQKITYDESRRWQNAIKSARIALDARRFAWNGSTLVIRSSDTKQQYRVTATTCQCRAFQQRQPCYHRAARKLILNAIKLDAWVAENIRTTPAERAIDAMNAAENVEAATDADHIAWQGTEEYAEYTDALNKELFG